ncbi:MAG: hypothetical protein IKY23_01605 [Lachnospiraceae bacterium]|nr:hypothetical protein [Lachnospiraceae bacterium]
MQEEQAEVVTDIAVVNLDEGIYEGNEKVFYFSELMNLEEDFFVPENLEAAREGINNGSYAAYILIPAEFSENAVSINGEPEKAILEFAMNPNLREDISRLTMSNIKNFEITLNTNMSYMYVQAILEEFHTVQDQAGLIMENDSEELQRIQEINAEDLLTEPDFEEVQWAEADLETVDFSSFYSKNETIEKELRENIEVFIEEGEEAFSEIKEKENTVIDGVDKLYQVLAEVDIETDENGNIVYENGKNSLSNYLSEYDGAFDEQKDTILKMLGLKQQAEPVPSSVPEESPTVSPSTEPESDVTPTPEEAPTETPVAVPTEEPEEAPTVTPVAVPTETPEEDSGEEPGEESTPVPTPEQTPKPTAPPIPELIKEVFDETLKTANQNIAKRNEKNTTVLEEIQNYILLMEEAESLEVAQENWELLKLKIEEFETVPYLTESDMYDMQKVISEFEKLAEEIDQLPKVDREKFYAIFEEEMLTPLQNEILAENERIQKEGNTFMETLEKYMEELSKFDPYEYYDSEKTDELMNSFADNINNLENKSEETYGEYLELVYDTVDTANESVAQLQGNLDTAYEGTTSKIHNAVLLAQEYREDINHTNLEILGTFRQKLPYTRIGNLEYVQVYDFVANPVKLSDTSVDSHQEILWKDFDTLKNIMVALIVLWCISLLLMLVMKWQGAKKDNG